MIPIHILRWKDSHGNVIERTVPDREAELIYNVKCREFDTVEWQRSDRSWYKLYERKGVEVTVWRD